MKFLICFAFFSFSTYGQVCLHKNLSKSFNYNVKVARMETNSCKIKVDIIEKESNRHLQTINIDSEFIFEEDFKKCSTVRSYISGFNKNKEDIDNDYGDFIVADFNFDGKEDFAVKTDSGGNGGPNYTYYIQNEKLKFELDQFLTETVRFFPSSFDKTKKTLSTFVHASASSSSESIYGYNSKTKKWKFIKESIVKF
ncbi:hypothetical protein GKZ90_0020460 [Flavobacterium sp. MC2016-06]|uniref:XAC2610-related protein n=1 Tax=Flavobacterium sp. MC2016-06 TaxID=2676308 RepID=UPI0031DDD6E0